MIIIKKIIYDHYGQTGNRFWGYADTVAYAISQHKHIAILSWDNSIVYYDRLRGNKYIHFPLYINTLIKRLGGAKLAHHVDSIIDKPLFSKIANSKVGKYLGFIQGWPLRNSDNYILQCKEQLVELFYPNEPIKLRVDSLFNELRRGNKFIIGLHIRRGDYSTWRDGEFYFSFEEYAKWMKQLIEVFYCDGKTVCFYIASNEKLPNDFSSYEIYQIQNATVADDLYALQLCDIIIGPTSTFSRWASFMGDVPLHIISSRNEEINKESVFSKVKVLDEFSDGRKIWKNGKLIV